MLLNDNKKLAYWQFIRHFGYNKQSAAFTNSKKAPPKRGDNDMMLTSNKLGRDSILIRGSVQSKVFIRSTKFSLNFNCLLSVVLTFIHPKFVALLYSV